LCYSSLPLLATFQLSASISTVVTAKNMSHEIKKEEPSPVIQVAQKLEEGQMPTNVEMEKLMEKSKAFFEEKKQEPGLSSEVHFRLSLFLSANPFD
jgi:hypothetical protein